MTKVDQIIGWISIEIVYKVNTKGIAFVQVFTDVHDRLGFVVCDFVEKMDFRLYFALLLYRLFCFAQKKVRPRPCIPNIQIQHT